MLTDQLAVTYRKAGITPRQRTLLDFGMKVCLQSDAVGEDDFAALHAHRSSDEDAWDIAGITALFGPLNRMADVTSMRPNDEFSLLDRLPRT